MLVCVKFQEDRFKPYMLTHAISHFFILFFLVSPMPLDMIEYLLQRVYLLRDAKMLIPTV